MHQDPLPSSRGFPDPLTMATHRAVEIALGPPSASDSSELHQVLRDLCAEAHRRGFRAEELIVLFKKTIAARPELQARPREETSRLVDRIVSMCIEEYYGAR